VDATHAFVYRQGRMTDLGTLPGPYTDSFGEGINDAGQVVGTARYQQGELVVTTAFLWDSAGGMRPLLGSPSTAVSVNNVGQVVGSRGTPPRAYLYSDGRVTDLGDLGGRSSGAHALNYSGQVVGSSRLPLTPSPAHAVLWDGAGGLRDLGTLPAFPDNSAANGVNGCGQAVGYSYRSGTFAPYHAFLWDSRGGPVPIAEPKFRASGYACSPREARRIAQG
jgi:probable HAF family extracellular repeat protein